MNTALLIEPRKMDLCAAVIRNFQEVLGKDWKFIFLCGAGMTSYYIQLLNDLPFPVELWELNVTNLACDQYNNLLTSRELWEITESEFVLIFQTDTWLNKNCSRTIDEYFIYSYVGGNRDYEWKELTSLSEPYNPRGPFNGGLSLRRRLDMIRIIDHFQTLDVKFGEDVMFTMGCYMLGLPIGDSGLADTFCIHSFLIPDPFGFHIQSHNEKVLQEAIQCFPDLQHSFYPTLYNRLIARIFIKMEFNTTDAILLIHPNEKAQIFAMVAFSDDCKIYITGGDDHTKFIINFTKGQDIGMDRISIFKGIIELMKKSAEMLQYTITTIQVTNDDNKNVFLFKDSPYYMMSTKVRPISTLSYFTWITLGIHIHHILHVLHIICAELFTQTTLHDEDQVQLRIFLEAEKDVARHLEKEDITVYTMAVILVYWIRTKDNSEVPLFIFQHHMTLIVKHIIVNSSDKQKLTDGIQKICPEYCHIVFDLFMCASQDKISQHDEDVDAIMIYGMHNGFIFINIKFAYALLDTWCATDNGLHTLGALCRIPDLVESSGG